MKAHRNYSNQDGKRCFGDGGPTHHEKDGFSYSWSAWYNNFMRLAEPVLLGWDYTVGYDTKRYQKDVEPHRKRVEYLVEHYPGPFADAVRSDFDAMVDMLAGEERHVPPEALEYRSLGDVRAEQVSRAADAAFQAYRRRARRSARDRAHSRRHIPSRTT